LNLYAYFPRLQESVSGEPVTPATALQVAAVFACVKVLAEDVGTLPLQVYRRTADGKGKERAEDDSLYRLLHLQPNPEMSSVTWRQTMMVHLGLWNRHFSEIVRDPKGKPLEIWPIPNPDWVTLHRRDDKKKTLYYRVAVPGGGIKELELRQMLHVRGLSIDGYISIDVLSVARDVIGLALASQKYAARYFRNGAEPSAVLEYPNKLTDEAYKRLLGSYKEQTTGENRHGMVILENGAKWIKTSNSPAESQLTEARKEAVIEICRYYCMPPHKIGALERATNNNVEQQDLDYFKSTLRPQLVNIEQELTIQLAGDLIVEFLIAGLLRGDQETRYQSYALGIQNGFLSPNEVRAMENLNPRPGGDVYYHPANMIIDGKENVNARNQN